MNFWPFINLQVPKTNMNQSKHAIINNFEKRYKYATTLLKNPPFIIALKMAFNVCLRRCGKCLKITL